MGSVLISAQHEVESDDLLKQQKAKPKQDRNRFTFQQNWFELIQHEWEERTYNLRGRKLRVLEIGSFEGQSTTWILDNLMSHAESTTTAIDTFAGGMEHQLGTDGHDSYGLSSLEKRFLYNVSQCEYFDKLKIMKMHSDDALLALRRDRQEFDFIYIDASHIALDVMHDAVVCWRMLSPGGTIVFDDFSWKGYMEDCYNPRIGIEGFIRCAEPEVETEETESQLWVKRVPNKIPATPNPDPDLYYWDRGLARKQEQGLNTGTMSKS